MTSPHASCRWQPNRREFLYVGLLGTVGLTMSDMLRGQAHAATVGQLGAGSGKAKSVINIYLPGGMSHHEEEQLREDHFLFQEPDSTLLISGAMHRDWPDARGIWHNNDKNCLVWSNEEDHMRIISMEMGADIVNVFGRFVKLANAVEAVIKKETGAGFSHSAHLGYILTCPSNLGTGLRASMMVKLPLLGARPDFVTICSKYKLQPRGAAGVDSAFDGTFDISNSERLGKSEVLPSTFPALMS